MPYNHDATWAEQAAAPSTPSAGHWKLYPKAGGFFAVDDAGNEFGPFSSETVALLATATELTISSGTVTVTQSHHTIDTQANDPTDDLDTINGGQAGQLLYIRAIDNAHTIVLKHGTGNIVTSSGSDIVLETVNRYATLLYDDINDQWIVLNLTSGHLTGGGIVATGGFTLTVPATGTAALLGTAQTFTAQQTMTNGLNVTGGNVGIGGTATPTELLVVGDDLGDITSAKAIALGDAGSNPQFSLGNDGDNRGILQWVAPDLKLYPRSGGVTYGGLWLKEGNVGIDSSPSGSSKLDVNGDSIRIRTAKTPASATATGVKGQIAWDANFLYVAVGTNSWKRVALASW